MANFTGLQWSAADLSTTGLPSNMNITFLGNNFDLTLIQREDVQTMMSSMAKIQVNLQN